MKKRLFMFATAALMLAACSNDGEVAVNDGAAQLQSGSGVVAFDTYTSSATKAGYEGIMTTGVLKTEGFGVFAQYSDGSGSTDGKYSKDTNPVANFMWNQKVSYGDSWTYSPLKYWPNETDMDSQTRPATSDHTDKLSFFAYAPYVVQADGIYTGKLNGPTYSADPTKSDSKITANGGGLEAVISNTATGTDPWVRYAVATDPSKSVDLLWGVAPAGGLQYTAVDGTDIDVAEGMPLINLIKPAKDQKIKFLFKHALARLGMTIVAAVDQVAPGGTLAGDTKIYVESVQLDEVTATKQLKMKGALNLKNTSAGEALWEETSEDFAGLIVNKTGLLNPDILWDTDVATTVAAGATGVTTSEKDVIKDNTGKLHYFMVIPSHADTDIKVTITYYVVTADPKVKDGYSVVKNVIRKAVTVSNLTNNKAYNLKLVLGLTSVKMEAEVADWQVDGSTEVYLPQNKAE